MRLCSTHLHRVVIRLAAAFLSVSQLTSFIGKLCLSTELLFTGCFLDHCTILNKLWSLNLRSASVEILNNNVIIIATKITFSLLSDSKCKHYPYLHDFMLE